MPDITGDYQTVDRPTPGGPNQEQTAVVESAVDASEVFRLGGNWPNPFNAGTVIAFDLPATVPVRLIVFDVLGSRVRTLRHGEILTAGQYRTAWNGLDDQGRPVASGVYLYRLVAGQQLEAAGQMALIR